MTTEPITINAENMFSTPLEIADQAFSISVRFLETQLPSAKVTLERKRPGEPDEHYRTVATYTETIEDNGDSVGTWDYRIGCKTGDYSSGIIIAEISD